MGPASHGHNLSHRSLWGAGTPHTYLITTYCLGHILFFTAANGIFTFAMEDYGIFDKCLRSRGQGRDLTNLILDTKHVVESKMTKKFKTWRNSSYHIRGRALLPRRLMKNNHEWFCLQKGVRERCRKESINP